MQLADLNKNISALRTRLDWQIAVAECCWCEDEPLEIAIAESELPRETVEEIYRLKDQQERMRKEKHGTCTY
jgi:hypothetical protein